MAVNEVQILTHLQELPESRWQAAHAPVSPHSPFVPLLGESPLAFPRGSIMDSALRQQPSSTSLAGTEGHLSPLAFQVQLMLMHSMNTTSGACL